MSALRMVAVALAASLLLAGCASSNTASRSDDDHVTTGTVTLPSGATVECVFWVPNTMVAEGAQMECFPTELGQLPTLEAEQ